MSDFKVPTLFVVPVGNVLPTTGSTALLADGVFGIFQNQARTAATAGNIAGSTYIQLAQGRPNSQMSTKFSDKISLPNVTRYYQVTGEPTFFPEVWTVGGFTNVLCETELSISLRVNGYYPEVNDPMGLKFSATIQTPCCNCGDSPCITIASDVIVQLFYTQIQTLINAQVQYPNALTWASYVTVSIIGTPGSLALQIQGNPLVDYEQPCDFGAFPWQFDRVYFRPFVQVGPATTADFEVYDPCAVQATIALTQRSSYPRLSWEEVYWMEKEYASYQESPYKDQFLLPGFNVQFASYVATNTYYDLYVIEFNQYDPQNSYTSGMYMDERVLVAVPQGSQSSGFATILNTYLGSPINESPAVVTTTTTTSTSSTSSTTTTTTTFVEP
jgi:hypothetical protein